jgi:hypothetical protein
MPTDFYSACKIDQPVSGGRGFANRGKVSRTRSGKRERVRESGTSLSAESLASKPRRPINGNHVAQNFRPGQYANPEHQKPDSQTSNQPPFANPLERQGSTEGLIHETWKNDSVHRERPNSSGISVTNSCSCSRLILITYL